MFNATDSSFFFIDYENNRINLMQLKDNSLQLKKTKEVYYCTITTNSYNYEKNILTYTEANENDSVSNVYIFDNQFRLLDSICIKGTIFNSYYLDINNLICIDDKSKEAIWIYKNKVIARKKLLGNPNTFSLQKLSNKLSNLFKNELKYNYFRIKKQNFFYSQNYNDVALLKDKAIIILDDKIKLYKYLENKNFISNQANDSLFYESSIVKINSNIVLLNRYNSGIFEIYNSITKTSSFITKLNDSFILSFNYINGHIVVFYQDNIDFKYKLGIIKVDLQL
jgi:hypothetical protein